MVQPDAVKTVLQGQHPLNLVGLHHGAKHLGDGQRLSPLSNIFKTEVIGCRKDAAQVVRRMPPFGGQPGVVEIQPAHHGADIERRHHRIQAIRRSRHPRPVFHLSAGDHRPQQLGAGRKLKGQHGAGKTIQQTIIRGVARLFAPRLATQNIVGDLLQQVVGLGTMGGANPHIGHVWCPLDGGGALKGPWFCLFRLCRRSLRPLRLWSETGPAEPGPPKAFGQRFSIGTNSARSGPM